VAILQLLAPSSSSSRLSPLSSCSKGEKNTRRSSCSRRDGQGVRRACCWKRNAKRSGGTLSPSNFPLNSTGD
jgi:hypothetical protein